MEYELNTDAIKKRFEGAVVVGRKGEIHVFLPAGRSSVYFSLTSQGGLDPLNSSEQCEWVIKHGDKCEVSDDGRIWVKHTFGGFFGSPEYPFMVVDMEEGWKLIRPVSQLTERQKKEQELEETINKAQKELKELRGMVNE